MDDEIVRDFLIEGGATFAQLDGPLVCLKRAPDDKQRRNAVFGTIALMLKLPGRLASYARR